MPTNHSWRKRSQGKTPCQLRWPTTILKDTVSDTATADITTTVILLPPTLRGQLRSLIRAKHRHASLGGSVYQLSWTVKAHFVELRLLVLKAYDSSRMRLAIPGGISLCRSFIRCVVVETSAPIAIINVLPLLMTAEAVFKAWPGFE